MGPGIRGAAGMLLLLLHRLHRRLAQPARARKRSPIRLRRGEPGGPTAHGQGRAEGSPGGGGEGPKLPGSGDFARHGPRRRGPSGRGARPRLGGAARAGPLAPPRPAPRRASGSLAAAGARLQRQRGPPGFVSVGLGVFCPGSGSSKKTAGRNRRRTPAPRSTSLTGAFLLLLPFLPPALRSPFSSLFPPSLLSGLRVSLGCHVTASAWGGAGGAAMNRNKEESFWVFFSSPLSQQSGLSSCATSDLLGAPADFPLVNSHGQEEARLRLPYIHIYIYLIISGTRFTFCIPRCSPKADKRYWDIDSRLC